MLQVLFDLVAVVACTALWIKLHRPAKDDPRLSRGLQLLQTKISVLEDLSDRTETQVNQLISLMEHKVKEVQEQIMYSDKQVQKIEASMNKSKEVAKIFQDRIPHQEIVERQNTIKYVKAARLAHQGLSISEIAQQVDLSLSELEFIAKVNKNQLQFSEQDLPDWAREEDLTESHQNPNMLLKEKTSYATETQVDHLLSAQPLTKQEEKVTLSELGDMFRRAITPEPAPIKTQIQTTPVATGAVPSAPISLPAKPAPQMLEGQNSKGERVQVRKVVFPKVDPQA